MTEPIEIARYRYRHLAEIAKGRLDDAGISSAIMSDDIGGTYVGIAPARLLVAPENADRARELLADEPRPD